MNVELLDLGEGRTLEIVTQGAPSKKAFILHHGGFGCSEGMAPIYRAAEPTGIFTVGITRGGYAQSTRREGRRALDYVQETRVVLDHFGVEEFVSFGWSSGGLGTVSDLQDHRCKGGIGIASDAEPASPEWPSYLERYPANNWKFIPFPAVDLESLATIDAAGFTESLLPVLSEVDIAMMNGPYGEELATWVRKAMAAGPYGIMDDAFGNESAWGIDFGSLTAPMAIYQGDEDRICVPAHGYYLADKLRNSELILKEGQGHLSLIYDFHDEMVEKAIAYLSA